MTDSQVFPHIQISAIVPIKPARSDQRCQCTLPPQLPTDHSLVFVIWSLARASTSAITIMPLPQRCKPLLLGMGVDIGTDGERNYIEERHPGLLGKELLREGKCDWGGDPADSHHGPETSADGGANLVPGAGAGDEGHAGQVDGVLDWCDLDCMSVLCG